MKRVRIGTPNDGDFVSEFRMCDRGQKLRVGIISSFKSL